MPRPADVGEWLGQSLNPRWRGGAPVLLGRPQSPPPPEIPARATHPVSGCKVPCISHWHTIVGNPGIASMKSNTSKAFSNFAFFLPSIEDIIMKSLFLTRGRGRGCAVLHICMYVTRLGHDESTTTHDLDSLKRRDKNTGQKKGAYGISISHLVTVHSSITPLSALHVPFVRRNTNTV